MTGSDLLCAISAADKKYAYESKQFSVIAAEIKADRRKKIQRSVAIGIAAVLCIAVFGAVKSMPQFFKVNIHTDTTNIQTPVVIPPGPTPSQQVPATLTGTTRPGQNDEQLSGGPAGIVPSTAPENAREETSPRQSDAPTHVAAQEYVTSTASPTAPTTQVWDAEPFQTTAPTTSPEGNVVMYQMYTYNIAGSAFSGYRLGKAVVEETVGEPLEDAAATGVYVNSDGTTQEDETLRCRIFSLTGVDPGIAVCVRFIDRGKGLKTDRYYLLYHPDTDVSAFEAYLIPQS